MCFVVYRLRVARCLLFVVSCSLFVSGMIVVWCLFVVCCVLIVARLLLFVV